MEGEVITNILLSDDTTVIMTSLDRLFMCGNNACGHFANGTTVSSNIPVEIYDYSYIKEYIIYEYKDTITPYMPTKLGYTFDGLYLDNNFTIPFEKMVANDFSLYGRWYLEN